MTLARLRAGDTTPLPLAPCRCLSTFHYKLVKVTSVGTLVSHCTNSIPCAQQLCVTSRRAVQRHLGHIHCGRVYQETLGQGWAVESFLMGQIAGISAFADHSYSSLPLWDESNHRYHIKRQGIGCWHLNVCVSTK